MLAMTSGLLALTSFASFRFRDSNSLASPDFDLDSLLMQT
jgi:hypothetical protein